MKRSILTFFFVCLMPSAIWALSPEEAKMYFDYNTQMAPLSEKLQQDLKDCGNDPACQMQVMFRFQSEMAKIQLPDVKAYPSNECGLLGSPYPNCRNVSIEIRYSFDEKIYEWDDGSPYLSGERSLAFGYTVDGVLGYNDDFTLVHLFQRHPPLKENIRFEDGKYRSFRRINGVKQTDTNISIGNVNMNDPRSLISFFDVSAETEGEKAKLLFTPFDLVTGGNMDDPTISGMLLPPDGYDEITIDPSELKTLVPDEGHWSFSRSFTKTYDDIGSKYLLHFTVNVTSQAPAEDAVKHGDPAPRDKKPELVVSPDVPLNAKRHSAKKAFQPREITYTLTNVGDSFLSFTVNADVPWFYPQSESGDLKPKDHRTLTVKLNNQADILDEKDHVGRLRFINLTGGKGSTSREVKLSTGEKWRYSYYGYMYHGLGGGAIDGGMIVFWQTDVDFVIRSGKYEWGKGHSYLVKTRKFSYPAGFYDCEIAKGQYTDNKLKNRPTPYITETHFPVSGYVSNGFVTLNFANEANEYLVHIRCFVDPDEVKALGYTPWKSDPRVAHLFAHRMRLTGARTYLLQEKILYESGIKGKAKDYEAIQMKRLD